MSSSAQRSENSTAGGSAQSSETGAPADASVAEDGNALMKQPLWDQVAALVLGPSGAEESGGRSDRRTADCAAWSQRARRRGYHPGRTIFTTGVKESRTSLGFCGATFGAVSAKAGASYQRVDFRRRHANQRTSGLFMRALI